MVFPSHLNTNMDEEKQAVVNVSQATTMSATNGEDCPKLSNCKFGWQNISYSVVTKTGTKQILTGVDGCVDKGSTLCLIY